MTVERVAFLSSEYPPHVHGGLGTTVEALSRFLAARGVEIVLLVPGSGRYEQPPPGVELCPVPIGDVVSDEDYWLSFCESAVAMEPELRVDLVHCHDWMTALGGIAIGRRLGVPVLMSVHLPQNSAPNLLLENIGLAASDAVLVNGRSVRAELERRDHAGGEIAVIPNGVDLARFPMGGAPEDPERILFAGRLVPQKGVDVLLRAFGAVLRRHPGATLTIAGDGQQRLYLERLARFLGVRRRVSFVGWQPPGELAALYRACAVTAVPSLYEPFGLVALEAMASGRPVVAARIGGLAEVVEEDVSGFLVEPGDHLDLATRLAALLSDAALARAVGAAARRRAERFDWAVCAERTAHLYASLARGPAREPALPRELDALLSTAGTALRERTRALLPAELSLQTRGRHDGR